MTLPLAGADVVVIGGGLVGAALAYELVTAGADVVLVDRHDPGRATDAGAGILSPETNQDPDPGLFTFGMASARHYESLTARLLDDGVADAGFAVTGSLLVAERAGDDPAMDSAVGLVQGRCPGLTEEIDPGDASAHFPPLGPVRRALLNPAGRRVDGRVLNEGLRQAAIRRGLRVATDTATGLDVDRKSQVIRGVATSEGTIPAGAVALAGGAWSAELTATLGTGIPVTPLKGQIVHLSLPATDTSGWTICPLRGVTGILVPRVPVSSADHAPPARTTAPAGTVPSEVATPRITWLFRSTSRRVAASVTTRSPRRMAACRSPWLRTRPSTLRPAGLSSARRTGPSGGKWAEASPGSISSVRPGHLLCTRRTALSMVGSSPVRSAISREPVTAKPASATPSSSKRAVSVS